MNTIEKVQKKQKKITLDNSSSAELEKAHRVLKEEYVKISLSQLASEALFSYFGHHFERDREAIKTKYFDAQSFLRERIGDLKTKEDVERTLKDALKTGRRKKRKTAPRSA